MYGNALYRLFVGIGSALFSSVLKLMLYKETQDRFSFVFGQTTLCHWLRSSIFISSRYTDAPQLTTP